MSKNFDFKKALSVVYKTRNFDEELNNPFLIYSRMSDLIGHDYENEKKLKLFFAVEKRVNLFAEMAGNVDAKKLKKKYKSVSDLLSESAFNRLVDTVAQCVVGLSDEIEKQSVDAEVTCENDFDDQDASVVSACNENLAPDADYRVNQQEHNVEWVYSEEHVGDTGDSSKWDDWDKVLSKYEDKNRRKHNQTPLETPEPANSDLGSHRSNQPKRKKDIKAFLWCAFLFSIVVTVLCGVFETPWIAYQWIVGIASAIILLIGCITLSVAIYDEAFNLVSLGILVVTNFVLLCVFRAEYNIVCYWVTTALLIYGVYSAVVAFDNFEYGGGWTDVAGCVLSVGTLLLNIYL